MGNLKTKFAGLELNSPIIAGSCGLTSDIKRLQEIEVAGAGAVVLKSIFEEQINMEASRSIGDNSYPEETDYIQNYIRANTVQQYIDLVKLAKERLKIPVIASINCLSNGITPCCFISICRITARALPLRLSQSRSGNEATT